MNEEQYRVEQPTGISQAKIRKWCRNNLNGRVKIKYFRKYDPKKKKWVRDHEKPPVYRFSDDADAMAFKLQWITE